MDSKYTCLIVDDELLAHEVIQALLMDYPNIEFVKSCYDGVEALEEININPYDIVFLDVNMPKLSGMELLSKLKNKPAIIITTAYTSFAFEAYEHDAIDYLQKPIPLDRFAKAIAKAVAYAKEKRAEQQEYIVLKIDGLLTKVNQEDIQYVRSMENYSKYFINNRPKPIMINEAFSKQLQKLNSQLFIQTHRTCIINKNCITGRKGDELMTTTNVLLPIGRKYYSEIQNLFIQRG
jgi:DNA-binding LytR/AlgR family response regulator